MSPASSPLPLLPPPPEGAAPGCRWYSPLTACKGKRGKVLLKHIQVNTRGDTVRSKATRSSNRTTEKGFMHQIALLPGAAACCRF